MNCPNCKAAPGEKHAWGCPVSIKASSEATERIVQQQQDFAFAAAVFEEHY